jgi:hypothetical protein
VDSTGSPTISVLPEVYSRVVDVVKEATGRRVDSSRKEWREISTRAKVNRDSNDFLFGII